MFKDLLTTQHSAETPARMYIQERNLINQEIKSVRLRKVNSRLDGARAGSACRSSLLSPRACTKDTQLLLDGSRRA